MAFEFLSPPTEAPFPWRQRAQLRWRDSAVTIDTWLVEMYAVNMSGTVGVNPSATAYVAPTIASTNDATLNMETWTASQFGNFVPYLVFTTGTKPTPSVDAISYFYQNILGVQFQIYSVTGGVKSALQGSHNYIPIYYATNQGWDWSQDFSDYFPDSATKKGWMTDREDTNYIRVDMAPEDEGAATLLQMENYSYAYDIGKDTANCDWDTVNYSVFYNGTSQNVLNLYLASVPASWEYAAQHIPIGPANINDNAGWAITYDLTTEPWDYIQITPTDGATNNCKPIRVYRDCRPIKHKPAQLFWIGSRGGAEILRFDGRVKDNYDVGGRDTYTTNYDLEGRVSGLGIAYGFELYGNQPERVPLPSTGKRSFSLSEDFFSDAERELFKSAMTATYLMVRYDGQWYPCRMKTTNYAHEQSASKLLPISCEVELLTNLKC
jgi:hypothetical protein